MKALGLDPEKFESIPVEVAEETIAQRHFEIAAAIELLQKCDLHRLRIAEPPAV